MGDDATAGDVSLSIEETNRLRISLGLKPLDMSKTDKTKQAEANYAEHKEKQAKAAAAKEAADRIEKARIKRLAQQQMKGKSLAEEAEDESARAWISKTRVSAEKLKAQKTAAALDQQDEAILSSKDYTSSDLKGLKVAHDISDFKEGEVRVLTLQDRGILDEGDDDAEVLTNVDLATDKSWQKNAENRKKKTAYNPYDDQEFDAFGNPKERSLLAQYDEDIDGNKKDQPSFMIDQDGMATTAFEEMNMKAKLAERLKATAVSLEMDKMQRVVDYYTHEEMLQFKKSKKKKRTLKKSAAELEAAAISGEVTVPAPEEESSSSSSGGVVKTSRDHASRRTQFVGQGALVTSTRKSRPDSSSESDRKPSSAANNAMVMEEEEELATIPLGKNKVKLDIVLPTIDLGQTNAPAPNARDDVNWVDDDELQQALARSRRLAAKKREKQSAEEIAAKLEMFRESKMEIEGVAEEDGGIVLSATSEFARKLGERARSLREESPAPSVLSKNIPPGSTITATATTATTATAYAESSASAAPPPHSSSRSMERDDPDSMEVVQREGARSADARDDAEEDYEEDDQSVADRSEGTSSFAGGNGWHGASSEPKDRQDDDEDDDDDDDEMLKAPLEEEPLVGSGLAATMRLLAQKGILAKQSKDAQKREQQQIEHYQWLQKQKHNDALRQKKLMEEKAAKANSSSSSDPRSGKGGSSGGGGGSGNRESADTSRSDRDQLREIEEKFKNYNPDVNIRYVDEYGRELTPKEEFRRLAHKFHGKGSGRMKTEKRWKKKEEEMQAMTFASGQTSLQLVDAFEEKAKALGSAFVVLSKGNRSAAPGGILDATFSGKTISKESSDAADGGSTTVVLAAKAIMAPERAKIQFGMKRKADDEKAGGDNKKPKT